jgi:hypothetical protein
MPGGRRATLDGRDRGVLNLPSAHPATSPNSTRAGGQAGERRARQKPGPEPVHSTGMELDLISEPAARLRSQHRQGEAND